MRQVDARIAKFWGWWSTLDLKTRLEIATGGSAEHADELSRRVSAIHPDLAWEFGPGWTSEHALTLSGEGNAAVRIVAERWVRAAPPSDAHWSYFATRQAVRDEHLSGGSMEYEGVPLHLGDTRVATVADSIRPMLSVQMWHPGFAKLPAASRSAVAFLLLDQTLGEAGVERWIGGVDVVDTGPEKAVTLLELRETVDALAKRTPDEQFAIAKGIDPETKSPLLWNIDVTLRRWDHPFHDTWCDVVLSYEPADDGMPGSGDLEAFYGLQDELLERLGEQAVFAGTQTGMGRRHVWLFVDGDTDAVATVRSWAGAQSRETSVVANFDPGWSKLPI